MLLPEAAALRVGGSEQFTLPLGIVGCGRGALGPPEVHVGPARCHGRAGRHPGQVVTGDPRAHRQRCEGEQRQHPGGRETAGLLPPAAGEVSVHIPPGVARIAARLGDVPLAVFSADWTLLTWTPLWASLLGDPASVAPHERNLLRVLFTPGASPAWPRVTSDGVSATLPAALVADLRTTAAAHPHDRRLAALVTSLYATSPEFAAHWDSGAVATHESDRKTITHPVVGPVTLDCDVLTAHGSDLRIVVYTAPAGSSAADKLDLLRVTGVTPVDD